MLSIIIISKNEEDKIGKLLESIKSQSYNDYEIILSDAKSTDKTREIAKKYKIKIVEGGLPSVGRNNGAKAAKGDLLLFLDSDVVLPKDFLKENIQEFNNRNLATAGCYVIPMSNKIIDKIFHFNFNSSLRIMQKIYPHMAGFCIFAKKEIHKKLKGFDESILLAEDNDYVNRSKKYGKFAILKSKRIFISMRRFEEDGHFITGIKYLLCLIYRLIFGEVRSNIFNYKFDHYKKNETK